MKKKYKVIAGVVGLYLLLRLSTPKPIDIVDELEKSSTRFYSSRPLSDIDEIVVHHAAVDSSLPGANPYSVATFHVTYHAYLLPGIAYHLVVMPDGKVYLTNYLETVSYHVGTANPRTVGILVMGNFDAENFTDLQYSGLVKAVNYVTGKLGRKVKLNGHYIYSSKTCPGHNIRAKLANVRSATGTTTTYTEI
jgi:hypothetical protein